MDILLVLICIRFHTWEFTYFKHKNIQVNNTKLFYMEKKRNLIKKIAFLNSYKILNKNEFSDLSE